MGQLVDDGGRTTTACKAGASVDAVVVRLNADDDILRNSPACRPIRLFASLNLLGQAGIPATSVSGLPSGTIDDNVSFIGRIDHAPYDWTKLAYNPTTYGLQAYGKWGRTQAQGSSASERPHTADQRRRASASLTALLHRRCSARATSRT